MDIKSDVIIFKGKAKDVFKLISKLATDDPKKTIRQIWLEGKKN